MSNTHLTTLLNLPGVEVDSCSYVENAVFFVLKILSKGIYCPYSQDYIQELHQVRPILVRDLPVFGQPVYLKVPRRQFYCRFCQRYITEQLEFIDNRRKYTNRYEVSIHYLVNHFSFEKVSQYGNLRLEEVKNIVNHVQQKLHKKSGYSKLMLISNKYCSESLNY